MLKLAALLFGLDAVVALAMGLRYVRRTDLLPYQSKALGRGINDLDAGLRTVMLAMLRVIGGGFLGFGVLAFGLAVCLWQGERLAGFAFAAGAVALLAPAWIAASSVEKFSPGSGAPTRLILVGAGVALLGFLALLAS